MPRDKFTKVATETCVYNTDSKLHQFMKIIDTITTSVGSTNNQETEKNNDYFKEFSKILIENRLILDIGGDAAACTVHLAGKTAKRTDERTFHKNTKIWKSEASQQQENAKKDFISFLESSLDDNSCSIAKKLIFFLNSSTLHKFSSDMLSANYHFDDNEEPYFFETECTSFSIDAKKNDTRTQLQLQLNANILNTFDNAHKKTLPPKNSHSSKYTEKNLQTEKETAPNPQKISTESSPSEISQSKILDGLLSPRKKSLPNKLPKIQRTSNDDTPEPKPRKTSINAIQKLQHVAGVLFNQKRMVKPEASLNPQKASIHTQEVSKIKSAELRSPRKMKYLSFEEMNHSTIGTLQLSIFLDFKHNNQIPMVTMHVEVVSDCPEFRYHGGWDLNIIQIENISLDWNYYSTPLTEKDKKTRVDLIETSSRSIGSLLGEIIRDSVTLPLLRSKELPLSKKITPFLILFNECVNLELLKKDDAYNFMKSLGIYKINNLPTFKANQGTALSKILEINKGNSKKIIHQYLLPAKIEFLRILSELTIHQKTQLGTPSNIDFLNDIEKSIQTLHNKNIYHKSGLLTTNIIHIIQTYIISIKTITTAIQKESLEDEGILEKNFLNKFHSYINDIALTEPMTHIPLVQHLSKEIDFSKIRLPEHSNTKTTNEENKLNFIQQSNIQIGIILNTIKKIITPDPKRLLTLKANMINSHVHFSLLSSILHLLIEAIKIVFLKLNPVILENFFSENPHPIESNLIEKLKHEFPSDKLSMEIPLAFSEILSQLTLEEIAWLLHLTHGKDISKIRNINLNNSPIIFLSIAIRCMDLALQKIQKERRLTMRGFEKINDIMSETEIEYLIQVLDNNTDNELGGFSTDKKRMIIALNLQDKLRSDNYQENGIDPSIPATSHVLVLSTNKSIYSERNFVCCPQGYSSNKKSALWIRNPVIKGMNSGSSFYFMIDKILKVYPEANISASPYLAVLNMTVGLAGMTVGGYEILHPTKRPAFVRLLDATTEGLIVCVSSMNLAIKIYLTIHPENKNVPDLEYWTQIVSLPLVLSTAYGVWRFISSTVKGKFLSLNVQNGLDFFEKFLLYYSMLDIIQSNISNTFGFHGSLAYQAIPLSLATAAALINIPYKNETNIAMTYATAINFFWMLANNFVLKKTPLAVTDYLQIAFWSLATPASCYFTIKNSISFVESYRQEIIAQYISTDKKNENDNLISIEAYENLNGEKEKILANEDDDNYFQTMLFSQEASSNRRSPTKEDRIGRRCGCTLL